MVAAGAAAADAPPSLTTAMLEVGASTVLEPGFAQLLDMVPPLAAAGAAAGAVGQSPRCLGEKKEEAGVRRAVISRWGEWDCRGGKRRGLGRVQEGNYI